MGWFACREQQGTPLNTLNVGAMDHRTCYTEVLLTLLTGRKSAYGADVRRIVML